MMRVRTNLEAIPTIFLPKQMEEEEVTGLMQLASSWEVSLDSGVGAAASQDCDV